MPRKLIVIFLSTQLTLNEHGNDIDKQPSYMNYKETVIKLHNTGWKNSYHTSDDVCILGYRCGGSMYP